MLCSHLDQLLVECNEHVLDSKFQVDYLQKQLKGVLSECFLRQIQLDLKYLVADRPHRKKNVKFRLRSSSSTDGDLQDSWRGMFSEGM